MSNKNILEEIFSSKFHLILKVNSSPLKNNFYIKKKIIFPIKMFTNFCFFVLNDLSISKKFIKNDNKIKVDLYLFDKPIKTIISDLPITNEINILTTFFNTNTLKWLNQTIFLQRAVQLSLYNNLQKLITILEYIKKEYPKKKSEAIFLHGGVTLFLYGIRNFSDLDLYFDGKNIKKSLKDEIEKIFELDVQTSEEYSILKKRVNNPTNYFYFNGVKFGTLKFDIKYKRYTRLDHPRAIADLIAIKNLLLPKLKIPEHKVNKKFKKTVKYFLKQRHHLKPELYQQ